MIKTKLNGCRMREAVHILNEAIHDDMDQHFIVMCDHCSISILTSSHMGRNKGTIEVALRTMDDSSWISLENDDRPIIPELPLMCFPTFIRQFKSLTPDDFGEVWDAWDTIAVYMPKGD